MNIGEKNYVMEYTSVECDDNHTYFSLVYVYPILFFWALIFPFILMVILRIKRASLKKIKTMLTLGFLYSEYTSAAYYWEMIKIIEIMALLMISKILLTEPV